MHVYIVLCFCLSLTTVGTIYVNEYPKDPAIDPTIESAPPVAQNDQPNKEQSPNNQENSDTSSIALNENGENASTLPEVKVKDIPTKIQEAKPQFIINRERYPARLEWNFRDMGLRASIPSNSARSNVLRLYLPPEHYSPGNFNHIYNDINSKLFKLKFVAVHLYRLNKPNPSVLWKKVRVKEVVRP